MWKLLLPLQEKLLVDFLNIVSSFSGCWYTFPSLKDNSLGIVNIWTQSPVGLEYKSSISGSPSHAINIRLLFSSTKDCGA